MFSQGQTHWKSFQGSGGTTFFFLLLFWAEILYKLEKHTGDRMAEATDSLCACG